MEPSAIIINDQPVTASFFGEGRWLSDFVTPDAPDITSLYSQITKGMTGVGEKVVACWDWVANQVKYKNFISASISIEGKTSHTEDFWQTPSMCSRTHLGNCANKSFLLTSLVRNVLPADKVYCVLGNLYNGHASGHAWVIANVGGKEFILESTRNDVPMIEADAAERYEPVHYFNETVVYAIPDRAILMPMAACYSNWLRDYIDWAYVNRGR